MRPICFSMRLIRLSMRWVWLLVILSISSQLFSVAQNTGDGANGNAANGSRRTGVVPSREVFSPSGSDLPIDAFLFLSESGSQVVVPGTTWEQLEKLKRLEGGYQTDNERYVFQSLQISGVTEDGRAELDVTIRLNIEPTEGQFAKIPIGMSNFHLLDPVSVSGITEHAMVVTENGNGYQWWVRTDSACKAELKMKVAARVDTMSADSLSFELPNVPSTVKLKVDSEDVLGEVVSDADEVVTSKANKDKSTSLLVESSGGEFLLRWASRRNVAQQKPLLEVESRIDVRWDSPQDQPIASVRLTARNVKGAIERFQLLLPPGSVLLDVPRLGAGGQSIQFVPVTAGNVTAGNVASDNKAIAQNAGELVEVTLPEEERQQRIDLNFELQLSGGEISAETPLVMMVPQVVDSLRHRGEMTLRLGEDYRLRWETRPWVRSEPVDETDQDSGGRTYRFRFNRGSFELPMWLSTKERRLTLSVQSEVIVREATASLQMQINVGGAVVNNMLRVDDASWDVLSIINQETGQRVETFMIGDDRVIQWGKASQQEDLVFLLTAKRPLGQDLGDIEFLLPSISTSENEVVAGDSTLDLIGNGRTLMTVDLAASEGLTRIMTSKSEIATGATLSRFQVARFGEPVNVVGTLQNQPLRITLAPEATVEIDGSQLVSTVDWMIDSPLDLEGRLPIRIPPRRVDRSLIDDSLLDSEVISSLLPTFFGREESNESTDGSLFDRVNVFGRASKSVAVDWDDLDEPWVVTVDGIPATLRKFDNDRYELISERLANGTMSIRWRHAQEISSSDSGRDIQEVVFPRPQIFDVTMRGNFELQLRGDGQSQFVAIDSYGSSGDARKSLSNETRFSETQFMASRTEGAKPRTRYLTMDDLPREPVRLRLKSETTGVQDLSVEQLVLRTAIGHRTRQEQVLATVRRGSEFRVNLTRSALLGGEDVSSAGAGLSSSKVVQDSLFGSKSQNAALRKRINERNERLAQQVQVEAYVDGVLVSVENRNGWLVVDLPGDLESHSLELNVWIPQDSLSSLSKVRPTVQLPSGLGRVFWQVIAPLDSHVVWASPTVGRAMSWQFDQWRLYRQSSMSDQELSRLVGGAKAAMPPGNRYLYLGTDLPAFEVAVASRTFLWVVVASAVLLVTVLLTYVPATRNPLTAVIAALLFAGLILIAPDAAVLAGQFGLISMVLVIVMMAIRSLLIPGRHDRVFATSTQANVGSPSTRIVSAGLVESSGSSVPGRGGFSETESMRPPNHAASNDSSPGNPSSGAEIAS